MDIRSFWFDLVERVLARQRMHRDRIRVIRGVLKELRVRERVLLDLQRTVTDDEQREDLAGKLIVLRMQRTKGVRELRALRAERLAAARRKAVRVHASGAPTTRIGPASTGDDPQR
ncbi:hypothetical protein [Thioalkalivibrio paradoxus]|uniref:hypothetical protein n=1 Tax=Thioalkalivibrio paradoxus TaxID=108010 RepID=UPI00022C5C7B|nr:hypothetical protein [Thioalkalivibrio paradoxus]